MCFQHFLVVANSVSGSFSSSDTQIASYVHFLLATTAIHFIVFVTPFSFFSSSVS